MFFFIPAGTIHSAKNVGSGNGAVFVTYVVEKGSTSHAGQVSAQKRNDNDDEENFMQICRGHGGNDRLRAVRNFLS
jgi:hypothetical protein